MPSSRRNLALLRIYNSVAKQILHVCTSNKHPCGVFE